MGKATRWFMGLLGLRKDKENAEKHDSNYCEKKEKKKWGFANARTAQDSGGSTHVSASVDSAWIRSYITHDFEKEQSKHAIAVAAATAYAADAAVAAAQAAVAVVRLTSQGKGYLSTGGKARLSAAVKIQNVFRGFLARKALKALKGLVKLQALVKGYLVRKRAAATLHSMQALFRAQAAARAQRARRSINSDCRNKPAVGARKSTERFDENRSEFHSKRLLSSSYDHAFDASPKIVEVDTCGPKSRSRRITTCASEYGDDHFHHSASSPLGPARLSIPDCGHFRDYDWGFVTDGFNKFATAQNTPRFSISGRAHGPSTPTKSFCGDGYFKAYSNCPNYMANTQSFRAKSRSHSAPKHRPELGPRKRLSLDEMMASRSSFSGVRMQRSSCSQA